MKTKIFLALFIFILIFISGCWRTTENGKHYGQITAIEDTGLFWKTTAVYVKTDISSSQEEIYCLDKTSKDYDENKAKLELFAKTRDKVTIKYHSEAITWFSRCDGEFAIIDEVYRE